MGKIKNVKRVLLEETADMKREERRAKRGETEMTGSRKRGEPKKRGGGGLNDSTARMKEINPVSKKKQNVAIKRWREAGGSGRGGHKMRSCLEAV